MAVNIGTRPGQHHGPNGSFEGRRVPYSRALNGLLLVNPRSGREGSSPEQLVEEAERLGIRTHLLQPGDDPAEIAARSPASVLGIAGGDGSLAPVAAVALERDTAFVCVPFG